MDVKISEKEISLLNRKCQRNLFLPKTLLFLPSHVELSQNPCCYFDIFLKFVVEPFFMEVFCESPGTCNALQRGCNIAAN